MERIVTHPLYIRCKKVIDSCKTVKQLEVAREYWRLAREKTKPDWRICGPEEWFEYKKLWEELLK